MMFVNMCVCMRDVRSSMQYLEGCILQLFLACGLPKFSYFTCHISTPLLFVYYIAVAVGVSVDNLVGHVWEHDVVKCGSMMWSNFN